MPPPRGGQSGFRRRQGVGLFSTPEHAGDHMKTTISLVVVLLLSLPLVGQDRPDHYSGSLDFLLDNGETYHCAVLSESLGPTKWRLTCVTNFLPDYQSEGFVTIGGHTGGKILVAVVDFGVLVITPSDKAIRNAFTGAVGTVITSRQRFTLHRTTAAETEILFEALE